MPPLRTLLFTDYRHIQCGDLEWRGADGADIPLIAPPPPQIDAHAVTGFVPYGVRLVAQPARKGERLPGAGGLGRVMHDGGVYRSWSLKVDFPPGRNFGSYSEDTDVTASVAYTESRNGIDWSQPRLCRIDTPGLSGMDGFTVFVDPSAPGDERYKAVFMAIPPADEQASLWQRFIKVHPRYRDVRLREGRLTAMYGAVSPDGLDWRAIPEPLFVHTSDTDTSVYYDTDLGRYVMYTRLYNFERRWIGRAETADFRDWPGVEPLIWPPLDGPLSDDIYTNAYSLYPGLPRQHLMFPMFYHRWDQTSDVRMYSSADGIVWHAVPGGPVISPGEPGAWDGEFIHAGKDLVPLPGGEGRVGFLYSGIAYPHKYPRWPGVLETYGKAWASWPHGRLCAVRAEELGELYTFPVETAGRQLRLNARARRGGDIRVGLITAHDWNPVPGRGVADCDPIYGDAPDLAVTWRGQRDIATPEGAPLILHLRLRSADLFAVELG